MIIHSTTAFVPGATKEQVTDFFLHCTVGQYQHWWPGVHLEFYTVESTPEVIGSIVWFDEYVGNRRLKYKAAITRYERGRVIEYQMLKGWRLPAWLSMEFSDAANGVNVVHTLKAGYSGAGAMWDGLLKLYLSDAFAEDLKAHAKEEFLRLGNLLADKK